jgi:hypothetical protein
MIWFTISSKVMRDLSENIIASFTVGIAQASLLTILGKSILNYFIPLYAK